jgi:hypothetical protein
VLGRLVVRSPNTKLSSLDSKAQDVVGAGIARFSSPGEEWQLSAEYSVVPSGLEVKLKSTPAAVAYRDDAALGPTPSLLLDGTTPVQIELRSPSRPTALLVMLHFAKNDVPQNP